MGKGLNPADAERRAEKKKAKDKNKKQRHLVREDIMSKKTPGQIMAELKRIESLQQDKQIDEHRKTQLTAQKAKLEVGFKESKKRQRVRTGPRVTSHACFPACSRHRLR